MYIVVIQYSTIYIKTAPGKVATTHTEDGHKQDT